MMIIHDLSADNKIFNVAKSVRFIGGITEGVFNFF